MTFKRLNWPYNSMVVYYSMAMALVVLWNLSPTVKFGYMYYTEYYQDHHFPNIKQVSQSVRVNSHGKSKAKKLNRHAAKQALVVLDQS